MSKTSDYITTVTIMTHVTRWSTSN